MAWKNIAKTVEFGDGSIKAVIVDEKPIMLSRINGEFYAVDAICPHKFGYLPMGQVNQSCIVCPAHAAEFDLKTGKLTKGLDPARTLNKPITDLISYELKVENGEIMINL